MKTIGVLGGFGPEATTWFEQQVLIEARKKVTPRFNQGYPPMVTVHLRHPPILLEDGKPPSGALQVDPRVLDAARRLGEWADFLVIGANTPHLFVDEIEAASGRPVLSMVDLVEAELKRRDHPSPVGLLGLGVPETYVQRFREKSIEYITVPDTVRSKLDTAIYRTLELSTTDEHRKAAQQAIAWMRGCHVPVTILGCTEIPLLLGDCAVAEDLIDPGRLLAEAAVTWALSDEPGD